MTRTPLSTGLDALDLARRTTLMLLDGFPTDRLVFQPYPHCNHAAWIVGHIAYADDCYLRLTGGDLQLPDSWHKACGYRSTPVSNADAYPAWSELVDHMTDLRRQLVDVLRSLQPAQLDTPLPDDWKDFARDFGALPGAVACHESLHAGQLSTIRKCLGLPPGLG